MSSLFLTGEKQPGCEAKYSPLHPHLVPRLRMSGVISLLPTKYLIKHRNNCYVWHYTEHSGLGKRLWLSTCKWLNCWEQFSSSFVPKNVKQESSSCENQCAKTRTYKWIKTNCMSSTTDFFIITYEATCFDLICRSSSGFHTIGPSNTMHVGIPSCLHQ